MANKKAGLKKRDQAYKKKTLCTLAEEEWALNIICPTKKLGQKENKDDTRRKMITTTNARARRVQIGANLCQKS